MLTNATEVFQYFDKYLKFLTEEKKLNVIFFIHLSKHGLFFLASTLLASTLLVNSLNYINSIIYIN